MRKFFIAVGVGVVIVAAWAWWERWDAKRGDTAPDVTPDEPMYHPQDRRSMPQ